MMNNIDQQISPTILFQPFQLLLNDLIQQNKQFKQDINQLLQRQLFIEQTNQPEINQIQTKNIEQTAHINQLQPEINELKTKNIEQTTHINQIQQEINQLQTTNIEQKTHINLLQNDYQNLNDRLLQVNQSHNLLERNVQSRPNRINYFRKFTEMFRHEKSNYGGGASLKVSKAIQILQQAF